MKRAIRVALEKLPKGSDALDQVYQEAIERIEGQKIGFQEPLLAAIYQS
jgi:hypothetical protein